jgi:hypothetical protein
VGSEGCRELAQRPPVPRLSRRGAYIAVQTRGWTATGTLSRHSGLHFPEKWSKKHSGPVAQWSEPAAHNRLVPGSSPGGPTNKIKYLMRTADDRDAVKTDPGYISGYILRISPKGDPGAAALAPQARSMPCQEFIAAPWLAWRLRKKGERDLGKGGDRKSRSPPVT